MPFHFPLQRLLRYQKGREKEAQERLFALQRLAQQKEEGLKSLRYAYEEVLESYVSYQGERLDLQSLKVTDHYRAYLDQEIEKNLRELQQTKRRVSNQQKETLRRWQNRKVLENLRLRAKQRYTQEEKVKEQKLSDELALKKFTRVSNRAEPER
ncbi:MAG: flagellar export protein FliJ [Dethiobacteria bacterium]